MNLNEDGINGLGEPLVNTNSSEFKELQDVISKRSLNQSKSKVIENKLLSLRFTMENYLHTNDNSYVEVGWFLKELLRSLEIKNKTFAEYIDFKESNLSALFSGKRKVNFDLALKLGKIFRIDPALWIHIQSKNELIKLKKELRNAYKNYNIKDLIKKAS